MSKRFYSFAIISYAELKEIKPLLENANHWCYIHHSRDKNKHFHILATFSQNKSFAVVRSYVKSAQNTFCEELDSASAQLRYFTHIDHPEKVQYSSHEIVYDNIEYWQRYDNNLSNDKNTAFINDLLDTSLSEYDMACRWGRDYIKNRGQYAQFRATLHTELHRTIEKASIGIASKYDIDTETGAIKNIQVHYELDGDESTLIDYIRESGINIRNLLKELKK